MTKQADNHVRPLSRVLGSKRELSQDQLDQIAGADGTSSVRVPSWPTKSMNNFGTHVDIDD